jgi:hypothetical protein
MDGKEAAQAWQDWEESETGQRCLAGTATGQYLKNRLWRAFMAGVEAAKQARKDEKDNAE